MQQQLLLSLLEKAPDDATTNVWQAQNIQHRAEALSVLGRLIAKAAAPGEPIAGSEEPSDE